MRTVDRLGADAVPPFTAVGPERTILRPSGLRATLVRRCQSYRAHSSARSRWLVARHFLANAGAAGDPPQKAGRSTRRRWAGVAKNVNDNCLRVNGGFR
jgi:hypothetical protein